MKSESIKELAAALSKVQREIKPAIKKHTNPFYNSKYADLEDCWDAAREPLTKNGLAVIQTIDATEGGHYLVTTLAHTSGEWIESRIKINPDKNTPQAIGSSITYLRRYTFSAIIGVTTEDDDGNAASDVHNKSFEKKVTFTKPTLEKKPEQKDLAHW